MRILFTFIGGSGHFEPLIPIAHAAQAAGHNVAFGCGSSMSAAVQAAGFTPYVLVVDEDKGKSVDSAPERLPLRPVDMAREWTEFRDRFVRDGAQYRAPLTLALCREYQPDVLVCDETDFGGIVAAECFGIPYAAVLVMAEGSFIRPDVVGEAINELRAAHSLPPDPALEMPHRYLVLSPFPPGFRNPAFPLPATAHSFRQAVSGRGAVPPWASARPGAPTIYFTLGTIFNVESGDLFQRVLAGLRDLPINVLVTVGRRIDPAEFGPQPAHIHIARFIPQAEILPYCDLVISHGGSGSVRGALAHGLPSVLIPMGADQPLNAVRCQALGVAQVLDPVEARPASVRSAVNAVLDDPSYRQAAERLRDEIAALPEVSHTVSLLERLRRDHDQTGPLVAGPPPT